jgi:hypothetical protein
MSSRQLKFMLAAAVAIAVGNVRAARAQSMLEVPGPSGQQQPSISAPHASPTPNAPWHSESTEEIPVLPPPAPPQAAQPPPAPPPPPPPPPQPVARPSIAPLPPQQITTVLPAVFRGCWQGQVPFLDSIVRLPGAHKVGYWTPKTYRLCYRRVGTGPFKLTFGETGIAPTEKITNARGHVDALATDGRAWAKMRSKLHFDEYPPGEVGLGPTFAVDETTTLDCRIAAGGMTVRADVYGTRDGEPWFRAEWHADFRQIESAASER